MILSDGFNSGFWGWLSDFLFLILMDVEVEAILIVVFFNFMKGEVQLINIFIEVMVFIFNVMGQCVQFFVFVNRLVDFFGLLEGWYVLWVKNEFGVVCMLRVLKQ